MMIPINLVFEDLLSEAVLRALLRQSPNAFQVTHCWPEPSRARSSFGCGYIRKQIAGFNMGARAVPFLVLTDLDNDECPPTLVTKWLPEARHPNLLFRVAVREVEAWVMADRDGFARFLGLKTALIPSNVEDIDDPKQFLLNLARKSRYKEIKRAIVPNKGSSARVGPGYNGELITFVNGKWNLERAVKHSLSLKRTVDAIDNFSWLKPPV